MAKCKNCGIDYYSIECPNCYGKKDNENIKINKNTLLIVIAIAVTIIALIMIKKEYEEYQAVQSVKKILYGTTDNDKIEKMNNKIINQTNQMMEQSRKMIDKANREFNKQMEIAKNRQKNRN